MKSIVLCADDYGQAPAISDGILALLLKKRLSAVSCLVTTPFWQGAASALMEASGFDIGLHFNLTEGTALSTAYTATYGASFFPLSTLLRRAFLRQLDPQVIAAEFEAQLDAFQAATGVVPHFIDGHQHVHQFPIIRSAVLAVYKQRLGAKNVYVRLAKPAIRSINDFKQLIILLSGGLAFRRLLNRSSIPHNSSFSGSYSFTDLGHYRSHFQAFLEESKGGGLIMCHPALKTPQTADSIAQARFEEYLYLASDQFLEDCTVKGVKIGQFKP